MTAVLYPTKPCPTCQGTGMVPDMPPGRLAAMQAAARQVPVARRILDTRAPENPLYVEALRLRVEYPDVPVARLAELTSDKVSPEGFRKRLTRALEVGK